MYIVSLVSLLLVEVAGEEVVGVLLVLAAVDKGLGAAR